MLQSVYHGDYVRWFLFPGTWLAAFFVIPIPEGKDLVVVVTLIDEVIVIVDVPHGVVLQGFQGCLRFAHFVSPFLGFLRHAGVNVQCDFKGNQVKSTISS
jgi:hypothetical protein